MGKTLKSPNNAENALPRPKSMEGVDVPQRNGATRKSPASASMGANTNRSKTPDMMGTLFSHKPDSPGV